MRKNFLNYFCLFFSRTVVFLLIAFYFLRVKSFKTAFIFIFFWLKILIKKVLIKFYKQIFFIILRKKGSFKECQMFCNFK